MYRLNYFAAVMLLSMLSACSGGSDDSLDARGDVQANASQDGRQDGRQGIDNNEEERGFLILESETSDPVQFTPVSSEFARRMRMPDTALLECLELPDDANLGKLPSAVGTDSLNGSQHFRIFGSASNAGTEKRLNSAAAYAAVMYRFSGYDFHKDPASLRITTSEHDFGGDTPGFVVAVADYEAGRWSYFGSSTSTEPYVKGLGTGNRYRSPASNVYIAVILPKGQVMNVDKVELDFNDVDWLNVEVDGEAGWTPGLEFLPNGNILIAYSDFIAGNPLAAVLDRSLDPSVPENWVVGDMNSAGAGVGLGQDVIIGPSGTPRISLAYTAIGSSSFNTLMGYTAYYDEGSSNDAGFFNYSFGSELAIKELSGSSSTDYNSAESKYGYATHFYSLSQPDSSNGACRYRQFSLNESTPQETITTSGGLTTPGYWFPRVQFVAGDSTFYFANNGGYFTRVIPGTPDTLEDIYSDDASHDIGSLAINHGAGAGEELYGFLYRLLDVDNGSDGPEVLRYVPLLENLNLKSGGLQEVDSMSASSSNNLADFQQLKFTSAGDPVIAYTRDEGSSIDIWYARWNGAGWDRERVNAQSINKFDANLRIWLDLALDDNDVAGVTWNHPLSGDDSNLMFAIRGS